MTETKKGHPRKARKKGAPTERRDRIEAIDHPTASHYPRVSQVHAPVDPNPPRSALPRLSTRSSSRAGWDSITRNWQMREPLGISVILVAYTGFQSTLPVWGATAKRCVCTNSSPAYCMRPISSRLRKAESAGNMFKNWCEATQQYVRSSPSHPTNKLQG